MSVAFDVPWESPAQQQELPAAYRAVDEQQLSALVDLAFARWHLHPDTEALRAAGERFSAWWEHSGNTSGPGGHASNVDTSGRKRTGPVVTGPVLRGRADRI